MSTYVAQLADLARRDPRYAYEAYEFVFAALGHTQHFLGREPNENKSGLEEQYHVSGRELVLGIRDLALLEFGMMARVVFRLWGIKRTADFGNIVFNLVAEKLMSVTDQDTRADFANVYDLETDLVQDFRIELDEAEWTR